MSRTCPALLAAVLLAGAIAPLVGATPASAASTTVKVTRHLARPGRYSVHVVASSEAVRATMVDLRIGSAVRRTVSVSRKRPAQLTLSVLLTSRTFVVRAVDSGGARLTVTVSAKYLRPLPPSDDAADPSGAPMPVGNLPGWHEVASDDFAEQSLDSGLWQIYDGFAPGGDPGGWWSASHVALSNGMLELSTYQDPAACVAAAGCAAVDDYVSGGVKLLRSQTYGKYLVRLRADNAQGVTFAALLWPTSDSGNGEIDFAEDNGASPRTQITTTLWNMLDEPTFRTLNVSMSKWHTVGVEWMPGEVRYTIDGRTWATVNDPQTPNVPMELALQQQTWNCGASQWEQCPSGSTPPVAKLDVAWVVEYAPS